LIKRPAGARREIEAVGEAKRQPLGAGPGDHGAVIRAQSRWRRHQFGADFERDAVQYFSDRLIGRDAAGTN
jgi:hypothetical protein